MLPEQPRRYEEISIHALREEGDKSACTNLAEAGNFYPRPPRGGRRLQEIDARKKARKFLSTPSARRATYIEYVLLKHLEISIHALREEGDQSREELQICIYISIHALREEGDNFFAASSCRRSNFYPRPPRGGRLVVQPFGQTLEDFYPRPPRGGRLDDFYIICSDKKFLSTPSARRATAVAPANVLAETYFYPRPPRGGRPPPTKSASGRT